MALRAGGYPTLAAAYAFGLVRNHAYQHGNKRIGFLAMVTFLGMNGLQFATDAEVVTEFVALADGTRQKKPRLPIGFGSTVPGAGKVSVLVPC